MRDLERRVTTLEQATTRGPICVALEEGETLDQAMQRLHIEPRPGARYIGLDRADREA